MDYTKPFRYISEIAKYQSISVAAEKLNIQQPSLSKYLKKVEQELGTELFDRSTTPIQLTQAGQCYLETAAKVIDADNQMQKQISDITGNTIPVHVGISPSRAPYLLPEILRVFKKQSPQAAVVIHEGNTDELCSGLSSGNLDLIISLKSIDTAAFASIKLLDECIMLAVPDTAGSNDFGALLAAYPIIKPGKGQILSNVLASLSCYSSSIECQNIITAVSMVEMGIGAAFVPSYIAKFSNREHIRYVGIPREIEIKNRREVCIFYRQSQILSHLEKSFIDAAASVSSSKRELEI